MSNPSEAKRHPDRVLKLMLIEDDPIFRLGLVACLEPFADLQVVLEADSTALALQQLRALPEPPPATEDSAVVSVRSLDLIILNLDLGQATASQSIGFALCQQIRAQYPQFPVLLLGSTLELTRLAAAFQSGAGGYCLKGTGVTELVTAIRQVAAGQPYWAEGMQAIAQSFNTEPPSAYRAAPRSLPEATSRPLSSPTWLTLWRQNVRVSGVQQIDRAIEAINAQRRYPDRSLIDQWLLTGQRRELLAARWLVNRLLATPQDITPATTETPSDRSRALPPDRAVPTPPAAETALESIAHPNALNMAIAQGDISSLQATLFQATLNKLQFTLQNHTNTPLEIDILKEAKKRELLSTVLRKLQAILDDLRLSQLSLEQIQAKRSAVLQDLWQAVTVDFFGKYYTLQIDTQPLDVVDFLLRDRAIVQGDILDKIPLFSDFLAHLLFQSPLTIDDTAYAAGTVEATARLELLLQHLIIQMANAVMQPLLNRLGDVVDVKQTFYDKRLLSSREIERFRNDLSWKYRFERLVAAPTAIFESQFRLFVLSEDGIRSVVIYAPRNEELAELSGIPFFVVLILETRDAIAPRLRAVLSFLGGGVVYILTEIIGRSIGLVGRGMIKGVGNALQETRPKPNRERWR